MASVSETLRSALTFHQTDDLPRAENLYRQILRIDPKQADALHLLGLAAFQQGRNESALDLINRAIAVNGKAAPYHNNLGNVSRRLGRIDLATECFRTAIELSPDYADAHYNLGTLLKEQGQLEQALESFHKTLQINPNHAEAHNNLGTVFKDLGRIDEAVKCYRRALEIDPESPEAHNNLGTAFQEQENQEGAIECHRRAIALCPDYTEAHFNLANTYRDRNRLNEAFASYQQALQISPDHVDSHINLGFALLLTGNLEAGFEKYEWRWEAEEQRRCFTQPVWDGTSLVDGTLLLYAEQGVGDEIFFASCLEDVLKKAPKCLVECDPRLVELYSRSFPNAEVIASARNTEHGCTAHLPAFDVQIPIGSLPRLFRKSLDSFPQRRSYLVPDPTLQEKWKKRFAELGDGLKVGISWRGGKQEISRRRRSTTLDQWEAILSRPGVSFVNLQYGDCVKELQDVHQTSGVRIYDWSDADPLANLDGFAAQISALDLVISMDNSTVHMAAALGVTVWTLLPFSPDWRWLLNRNDSPWYPGMQLFRQNRIGEWDDVFNAAADALKKLILSSDESIEPTTSFSASVASEETVEKPEKSEIADSAGEFSPSDDSCQSIEDLSHAQKTASERTDSEQQWLIENCGLRLDAHRPFFAETRREFHLSRYQFATQYCEEKRVLDAACGTGYGSALLAESAIEVRGIDACPRTIDYAQRNYGNGHLKFHKSRVEWIPFDEGYFDVVVSFETIEHTISPRWVLQEFARVLRADGTAVLSIPNSWGLTPHHFVDFDLPQLRELTEHFFEEQQYFYNNSRDRADRTRLGIGPLDDIDPKQAECILAVCRRPRKEHLGDRRLESLLDDLYELTVQRHQESLFSRKRSFPIQTIETKSLENVSKVRCGDMLILDAKRAGDQQGRVLLEIETDVEKWKADSVRINLPHIDLDNALPARLHIVRSDGTHVNSRSVQLVPKSSLRKC